MTAFDFSPLLRSTIGFERLMKNFDRVMNADATAEHYPPCNIVKTGEQTGEQTGEHTYRIEMAVAGFGEEDLAIEAKGDELVIAGKVRSQGEDRVFLHRGIATRQFRRTFRLAEHVKAAGAKLENGMLAVELVSEVPEALKPRRIEIGTEAPQTIEAA
ncbi:MAG: Hsp20 family protein [Alphaproteobacteria bacterium]|nr:Hsp20 family protein [Alphaproteobacteria bacterium]